MSLSLRYEICESSYFVFIYILHHVPTFWNWGYKANFLHKQSLSDGVKAQTCAVDFTFG